MNMISLNKQIEKQFEYTGSSATYVLNEITKQMGDKIKEFLDKNACEGYEEFKKDYIELEELLMKKRAKDEIELQKFRELSQQYFQEKNKNL